MLALTINVRASNGYSYNQEDSIQSEKITRWGDINYKGKPWTFNISVQKPITKGLQNKHITLWPSHGRYYDYEKEEWIWQRPFLFCTTEDLFTQSIVFPYLIPMLQNSGAVVYTPRERDYQTHELIVDNDTVTTDGVYYEKNNKENFVKIVSGFRVKDQWRSNENPMVEGTSKMIKTTHNESSASKCFYIPLFPEDGSYAVYVSYPSLSNSVSDACYIIMHKGIETKIQVNQKMGGNTWVYLGTFNFDKGQSINNCIMLSNLSHQRGVITCDAVRFGGGMGNIIRGFYTNESTSGMPRFLEGARYFTQWLGLPDYTYDTKNGYDDYSDDINARSLSMNYLGGGSVYIPDSVGKKVPFELSVAVHSDAGYHLNDSVYGTLAIYTTQNSYSKDYFKSGLSRQVSGDLASMIQESICKDMSSLLHRTWSKRDLFNRNYSETRWPEVPSCIIEMLSHQNFTDMVYGHNPNFKFHIARSIYKAITRYINKMHNTDCVIQPLPVKNFSALLNDNGSAVELHWETNNDSLEETATPNKYIIYTRREGYDFDNGIIVEDNHFTKQLDKDVIYSFKITALNEGGESFPSEILSVMSASNPKKEILIVNGFTRLSGPAIISHSDSLGIDSLGFDLNKDFGVPYICTAEYSGNQINYDCRSTIREGIDGYGYSSNELQGKIIAGNNFDYPYIHGKAIKNCKQYSFSSISMDALNENNIIARNYQLIDLIFGLQKDDISNYNITNYQLFSDETKSTFSQYLDNGGKLIMSGSYIASGINEADKDFVRQYFKYNPDFATTDSTTYTSFKDSIQVNGSNILFSIQKSFNKNIYATQHPDVIYPYDKAVCLYKYANDQSAAIAYKDDQYGIIALGFPFESIIDENDKKTIYKSFLDYLK